MMLANLKASSRKRVYVSFFHVYHEKTSVLKGKATLKLIKEVKVGKMGKCHPKKCESKIK